MIQLRKLTLLTTLACWGLADASKAEAQQFPIEPEAPSQTQQEGLGELGRTAEIGGTRVGQRQEADRSAAGHVPTARIDSRLHNRVQNRLRNRIDETYEPGNGTTRPFPQALSLPDNRTDER